MAKEHTGVLLLIAKMLRSTAGCKMLGQKQTFRDENHLRDWSLLVETLLQWEVWLESDKMIRSDVKKAIWKHRWIVHLIKKVAKQTQGMGLKLMKFHGISHMAQDILHFGVPVEFDTGSNESGHKATKKAALLTQKNKENIQQAGR